jgi:hypothetical protein
MVRIVISRARHRAKIRAKQRNYTAYLVLKGCVKFKTVCARTVRLSVPVIYLDIRASITGNPPLDEIYRYFICTVI